MTSSLYSTGNELPVEDGIAAGLFTPFALVEALEAMPFTILLCFVFVREVPASLADRCSASGTSLTLKWPNLLEFLEFFKIKIRIFQNCVYRENPFPVATVMQLFAVNVEREEDNEKEIG